MPTVHKKLVIIDPERSVQRDLKHPEHFLFRIEVESKDRERDAFLVLKSSALSQCARTVIEESLSMGNLRVVFVRMDTNADVFFDKLQEMDSPQLLRKLFMVAHKGQINRVLQAWSERRADACVASAYVDRDELVVQSCDLRHYRIRFADFDGLAQLSNKQRDQFQIDEKGNHICWPRQNVSLDLDVIRYKVDKDFRQAKNLSALSDYRDYLGAAIQTVMSKYQLTQTNLKRNGGPAERHLYRIERGEQELTVRMIDRLAEAHGLSAAKYIAELIAACDDIVERDANLISEP